MSRLLQIFLPKHLFGKEKYEYFRDKLVLEMDMLSLRGSVEISSSSSIAG